MTCIMAGTVFLPSCAYLQTHKNVEESYRTHQGYTMHPEIDLYQSGNQYYLGVTKQELRMHFPAINDSVFMTGRNNPTFEPTGEGGGKMYRQISNGTATVLQRTDGYAEMQTLSDELLSSTGNWLDKLPANAVKCGVKAEIQGESVTTTTGTSSETIPVSGQILSAIDQVVIDWPGTVLYNIAIPFMAPFVFFSEFLNEQ